MKVLITGANGQLGTDLVDTLHNHDVIPLSHAQLDITDIDSVRMCFGEYRPDVIINTAAYVRVDDCESNPDLAFRVNALGARNVAVIAQQIGAKLVHISTDYIFGGGGQRTSPFTEYDPPAPLNVYGRSKLAGEDYVGRLFVRYFIVRSSGLFGVAGSSGKGGNFVETILRLARERGKLSVVDDQVFSPTYTADLAARITQLIDTDCYGIFHITNQGECSWYAFAREILAEAGVGARLSPVTSLQYPQKAKRPAYSVLGHYHLKLMGMDDVPSWQVALHQYMKEKGHSAA